MWYRFNTEILKVFLESDKGVGEKIGKEVQYEYVSDVNKLDLSTIFCFAECIFWNKVLSLFIEPTIA